MAGGAQRPRRLQCQRPAAEGRLQTRSPLGPGDCIFFGFLARSLLFISFLSVLFLFSSCRPGWMPSIHPAALERGAQTAGAGSGSAPRYAGRRHPGRAQPGVGGQGGGGGRQRRAGWGRGGPRDLAGGKSLSQEDDSNLGSVQEETETLTPTTIPSLPVCAYPVPASCSGSARTAPRGLSGGCHSLPRALSSLLLPLIPSQEPGVTGYGQERREAARGGCPMPRVEGWRLEKITGA